MNPSQSDGQPVQATPANQSAPSTVPEPAAAGPLATMPDINANLLEQITVRARHVVSQTTQDPRQQAIELEKLKVEYIQKQYGLTIGKEQN